MSPLEPPVARRVAIVAGTRVPFARSDGPYATASNQEMLTAVLDALVERHGLQEPGAVGEFVAGAVLKHSRDFNLARETVLVPHAVVDDHAVRKPQWLVLGDVERTVPEEGRVEEVGPTLVAVGVRPRRSVPRHRV